MVFEAFRKRQKEMLAVLVLVAMFVFIAGDLPSRIIYGGSDRGNPRVGEIWNKSRTFSDIQKLETERSAAESVLMRIVKAADKAADLRRAGGVFTQDPWRTLRQLGYDWRLAYFALEGKADRIGVKVSDDDVTQFLTQISGNTLTRDAFKEALAPPRRSGQASRERGGETVSEPEFYRIMTRELKVRRALTGLSVTADDETPLDFWRLPLEDARTLFTLELVRIPVDKFIDSKAEPTNSDLKVIFDRYKSIQADSERGVVGFQRPATAEFEYASIPVDKWLDQMQVTDEECKKYYDANQSEFREELPIEQPADPKSMNNKGAPPKDAGKGVLPNTQVPLPPAKKEEKKAEPAKAAPKSKTDAKPSDKDKKTGALPALNLLRTIAATSVYVQTPNAKPTDGKKTPAPKADDTKSAPAKVDDKKAESAPPVGGKKVAPPLPVAPNNLGQAKVGEGVQAPKIKPYSIVKPEIEKKLKTQKARVVVREKIQKIIDSELAPYADAFILARRKFEDEHKGELDGFVPPKPPRTIESLAQELRGDFHRIRPTTKNDVSKIPNFGRRFQAVEAIFDASKLAYAAQLDSDLDESVFYVYWRTKYAPPVDADFNGVRDQVVAIWRREQAQKPAEKYADEVAEKAKKSGFAEALKGTDYKPFQPGPFRRSIYIPGIGNAVRLSQMKPFPTPTVPGVPDAKAGFINQAFVMEEGDFKVIPGSERENFYIVRCVKREPPNFEEFASEYEQSAREAIRRQEMTSERFFAQTAVRVLEESGYTPQAPSSRKGAPKENVGDDAQ